MGTFGKTTVGALRSSEQGYVEAYRHLCLETGVVTSISLYLTGGAAGRHARVAIYADKNGEPDILLGESASEEITSDGWHEFTGFNVQVSANTYYWLAFQVDSHDLKQAYDSSGGDGRYKLQAYSSFPNPFGTYSGSWANNFSIYATYTVSPPSTLTVDVTPKSATLLPNQSQTFTATVSGGTPPYTIQWIDNATGNVLGTGDTFTFTASDVGTYEIFARVTDNAGATADSQIITITVSPAVFDNCDQVDDWKVTAETPPLVIEVDTVDKVEGAGSLKGYFNGDYGGMFYKPSTVLLDFSQTPLLKFFMKLNDPIEGLKLEVVTGPGAEWNGFWYDILPQTAVGEWRQVEVDLRLPATGPAGKIPDLTSVKQISFFTWSATPGSPAFNWDYMTLEPGPAIPLQLTITPSEATCLVNESVTFQASTIGGQAPFGYKWYVNDVYMTTGNTFTFTPTVKGDYTIRCDVTDAEGKTASATASLHVLPTPPPPPPIPESPVYFKSEVRGVSVAYVWGPDYDLATIAETLYRYGINTVWVDVEVPYFISEDTWDGSMIFSDLTYHRIFIEECHKRGMHVIASLVTMMHAPTSPTDLRTLTSTGMIEWLDITKPLARELLKAIVVELATKYAFDGINLDYIRWEDRSDMPLGTEARDKFIADTGLSDVNWPTDVLSGGRYYWQFMNWRADVITELVGELFNTAKTANPNILISICPWEALGDAKWYWVLHIGQHAADMVDKGYCDFVSPMCYDEDASKVIQKVQWAYDLYVGSTEGKYPLIPWLSHSYFTPQEFANLMAQLKSIGIDGWIMNPYGGPGAESLPYPDVRLYLAALQEAGLMEPIWAIQNFSGKVNGNTATISWTTTVPTKSKIEYKDTPLFVGTVGTSNGITYKDIDYIPGTTQEDATLKTSHSFTIPITGSTQFRIQNTDENGVTVTSSPMTPAEVPPPPTPARVCFVATAAYGTPFAKEIDVLRVFRDRFMLRNWFGKLLVKSYYALGRYPAKIIRCSETLRFAVRKVLSVVVDILKGRGYRNG